MFNLLFGRVTKSPENVLMPKEFRKVVVRTVKLRDLIKRQDLKRRRRLSLQLEVIFLCIFLPAFIFWISAFGSTSEASKVLVEKVYPASYQNSSNEYIVKTLGNGFADMNELWQWINNVLFDEIFVQGVCGLAVGRGGSSNIKQGNLQPVPINVGLVRIRQLKVTSTPCPSTAAKIPNLVCFPEYSQQNEDVEAFPKFANASIPAYQWASAAATTEQSISGKYSVYPGSGFFINLTTGLPAGEICSDTSINRQRAQLLTARAANFFSDSTRAVVITLNTFSPNSGMLTNVRILIEISFSGSFHTSLQIRGLAFFQTAAQQLSWRVLIVFLVIVESVFVISSFWRPVFFLPIESVVWLLLDLLASALMIVSMYYNISFFFLGSTNPVSASLTAFQESFQDDVLSTNDAWSGQGFYNGVELSQLNQLTIINSVTLFLSCLRLIRCTRMFHVFEIIHRTFDAVFYDAVLFFCVNVIISIGYMLCGYLVLHGELGPWASYGLASFEILQYFVLNLDFYSISSLEPFGAYFAPLFIATFLLIFTWFFFASFVAVMYINYREVRINYEKEEKDERAWNKAAGEFAYRGKAIAGINQHRDFERSFLPQSRHEFFSEFFRELFGFVPRKGFLTNDELIAALSGEKLDKQMKKFIKLEDFFKLLTGGNISSSVDEVSKDSTDEYLLAFHPVVIQLSRLFNHLWLISEDVPSALNSFEEDEIFVSRSTLLRLEQSFNILESNDTESVRVIYEKLQSMKIEQQNLERSIRAIRTLCT